MDVSDTGPDVKPAPNVVCWVYVHSRKPSSDYTQHVVSALEAKWGHRGGGDGIKQWVWNEPVFVATLSIELSNFGSYLSLRTGGDLLSLTADEWGGTRHTTRWRVVFQQDQPAGRHN